MSELVLYKLSVCVGTYSKCIFMLVQKLRFDIKERFWSHLKVGREIDKP